MPVQLSVEKELYTERHFSLAQVTDFYICAAAPSLPNLAAATVKASLSLRCQAKHQSLQGVWEEISLFFFYSQFTESMRLTRSCCTFCVIADRKEES